MNEELLARLERDGVENLWVIYHDYSGRSCAKTIPKERFKAAVERGVVFSRSNLDTTLAEVQPDEAIFTANSGDFLAVPDPKSYAVLPYREATARAHAFMRQEGGEEWVGCPRSRLKRMVERFAGEGLSLQATFEAEFTLFVKTGEGEYDLADHDGMFTVTGLDRYYSLWTRVMRCLQRMAIPVEQLGKEYGPSQYELTTRHASPIKAVDDYLTQKEVLRALGREAGYVVSFMPKPYAHLPGNGLHIHLSLWDGRGEKDLTAGEAETEPLSRLGRLFVGGLLRHARALAGVGAPIVNSYKRLLPGTWAPAHACWGVANRAALVRIPAMGRRRHVEFRSGDNACNPFIYLAALLAAGWDGIRNQVEPPERVEYDVGMLSDREARERGVELLPRSLPEALEALEGDSVIAEALGPIIFQEFLKVKRAELALYDRHVHPWERKLYLEAI